MCKLDRKLIEEGLTGGCTGGARGGQREEPPKQTSSKRHDITQLRVFSYPANQMTWNIWNVECRIFLPRIFTPQFHLFYTYEQHASCTLPERLGGSTYFGTSHPCSDQIFSFTALSRSATAVKLPPR